MKDVIARLKEHQSPTPSKWRERAEWRMQNKSWLRHSQRIAVKMLEKMDELSMTQKQLADLMGCSQQYVTKCLTLCELWGITLKLAFNLWQKEL